LGWAIGDDEDLRTALLKDQLGRPGARMRERKGVFVVEQLPDISETVRRGRWCYAVRIRPELPHRCILMRDAHSNNPA
jgi:hypothetical protein